ncbi:hypothetical protein D3C80_1722150 [compost metagenome]
MLPPTRASAITAITGRTTAVTIKPAAASHRCSPDCRPTIGGKMILPAPTNRAKVIKPRAIMSLGDKRVVITVLLCLCTIKTTWRR